jgi:hypothetical protein
LTGLKLLCEKDGLYEDLDGVLDILTRRDRSSRPPAFLWSRVSDTVHRELLYRIASELNLPNPRLIPSKALEKHSFSFLNGASLNGLYSYYKTGMPRKPGVHIIAGICNKLDIPQVSKEDWLNFIRNNNLFSWGNVPNPIKREILCRAASELGYPHPIFLNNDDFSRRFHFLGNKSLTGLYTYYRNRYDGARGIIIRKMCEALDLTPSKEVWIAYITSPDTNIFWDIIPEEIIRGILYDAAEQLGYSNPRMFSIEDLKVGLGELNGMSLYSFASRYFAKDKHGARNIDFICDQFHIPHLTLKDWFSMISHQRNFRWDLIPNPYLKCILWRKAGEAGKEHPRMLKYEDMAEPCRFLNNKTLISLYNHHRPGAKKANRDTLQYICSLAGIPAMNAVQWIRVLSQPDSKTSWDRIPADVTRYILYRAAKELHLQNPRRLDYRDLCTARFDFLGGKTLSGLYTHYHEKQGDHGGALVQSLCDDLGIPALSNAEWIRMIADSSICHWENVPVKVQREILYRAASKMGLRHPRLMGTREFDSVPLSFLNGKTLSGLYYHYAARIKGRNNRINEFVFDQLSIPKMEIHPKTGRLNTLDNSTQTRYFDSLANRKDFVNEYLKRFPFTDLLRKYTAIRKAREAGIYRKGLITVLAPMSPGEYMDFLYEIVKNVPRDELGIRKRKNGNYSLPKSELYQLAGIKEKPEIPNRIHFADPGGISLPDRESILQSLSVYREILNIKIRMFHLVPCRFLVLYEGSCICQVKVPLNPGDVITDNLDNEYEVSECREKKTEDGYILDLKPFPEQEESAYADMHSLSWDSNDSILYDYLSELQTEVENDTLDPLLSVALGLKKEGHLTSDSLVQLPDDAFYNKTLPENETQRQAVQLSLSLDEEINPLAIIHGPPGTGKTTLIEEIALQSYERGENILILAKTNVAVDNILEKLYKDRVPIMRTGNHIEKKSSLSYAPVFSTSNAQYRDAIGDANCITLGTPMGFYLDRNKRDTSFDLLIIDEASQMDIPETLFSLGMAKKCIIIGDHLQIPPFPIQNEVLLEYDPDINLEKREKLQRSLFEKLITERGQYHTLFLDVNYRTENPHMISFISDLIYDGRLCPNRNSVYYSVPKQKREGLFPGQTIEVVDTSGIADIQARQETEQDSTYYNLSEAMLSVSKVLDLLKEGEKLSDICIITPYKAHAEKLKEVFLQHEKSFRNPEGLHRFIEKSIYTIDSFQGREQRNIIINWVRSNYGLPGMPTRTGFLKDYRRVNVALSRAKRKLILIGDYETLTQSENPRVRHIFTQIKQIRAKQKIVL